MLQCWHSQILQSHLHWTQMLVAWALGPYFHRMLRKELLVSVTFIKQFLPYLLGSKFKLRTDHSLLKWLQTFKDPKGQMARWLETLQEYQFAIVCHASTKHRNADSLSRRPLCTQCSWTEFPIRNYVRTYRPCTSIKQE